MTLVTHLLHSSYNLIISLNLYSTAALTLGCIWKMNLISCLFIYSIQRLQIKVMSLKNLIRDKFYREF